MINFVLNRYFSTQLSPRRLGLLFFLDKKQKQKNQDWLMQRCNAAPTAHNPVMAMLFFSLHNIKAVEFQINPKISLQNLISKSRIKSLHLIMVI